ncbi:transcriptional regulator [Polaribacter irgensii 23-P]|uniref:Transcriptional regulator n=1 Tax=Polaribacter irgensii 23-P TaxID=313594 RepID=A4C082_9FLAO|nr:helix-turn-helix domain-containing protein [Polaribacter irgensii]EAR12825.1 transcriptional regulator [Polaribacter irgensii 23-P]
MKLTYFEIQKTAHLIEEFYHISYSNKTIPYNTTIIPYGVSSLTFVYCDGQRVSTENNETELKNLVLAGQFFKSYQFSANEVGFSCGISFKPTTLHKLTNLNISKFTNKHVLFEQVHKNISAKLEFIFKNNSNNLIQLFQNLENLLFELPLIENKNTIAVDTAIDFIHQKQGLLSVQELLQIMPFGQKTLETQFKKIVGLTPAKYIRIHRFINLMKQYENKKVNLKDLIYMYDYYDESHFTKDFKSFTSKAPKDFFEEDFSIIVAALKK